MTMIMSEAKFYTDDVIMVNTVIAVGSSSPLYNGGYKGMWKSAEGHDLIMCSADLKAQVLYLAIHWQYSDRSMRGH